MKVTVGFLVWGEDEHWGAPSIYNTIQVLRAWYVPSLTLCAPVIRDFRKTGSLDAVGRGELVFQYRDDHPASSKTQPKAQFNRVFGKWSNESIDRRTNAPIRESIKNFVSTVRYLVSYSVYLLYVYIYSYSTRSTKFYVIRDRFGHHDITLTQILHPCSDNEQSTMAQSQRPTRLVYRLSPLYHIWENILKIS